MPTYAAQAAAAIKALGSRGGSSLIAIKKYLTAKNGAKGFSAVSLSKLNLLKGEN